MDITVYGVIATLVVAIIVLFALRIREARELDSLCAGASLNEAIAKANRGEPLTEPEKWCLVKHYLVLEPDWDAKYRPQPTERLAVPLQFPTGWERWANAWIRTASRVRA